MKIGRPSAIAMAAHLAFLDLGNQDQFHDFVPVDGSTACAECGSSFTNGKHTATSNPDDSLGYYLAE